MWKNIEKYLLLLIILLIIATIMPFANAEECNCEVDADCDQFGGLKPFCRTGCDFVGDQFKHCVPEFSDYAAIAALIGAITIPTLIYKFRKKNKSK